MIADMDEWVLVPRKPTQEMLDAAWKATVNVSAEKRMATFASGLTAQQQHEVKMRDRWAAMLEVIAPPKAAK